VGITQAPSGAVVAGDAATGQQPHEVIYEQAMRSIAALDETWQEAVRGAAVPAAAAPAAPAVVAPPVLTVVPPPVLGPAAVPAVPPPPRRPVPVTAEITAIGPDTMEAVIARADAPRWRRSLAY
jgi:hypothetical protein